MEFAVGWEKCLKDAVARNFPACDVSDKCGEKLKIMANGTVQGIPSPDRFPLVVSPQKPSTSLSPGATVIGPMPSTAPLTSACDLHTPSPSGRVVNSEIQNMSGTLRFICMYVLIIYYIL